MLAKAPRGTRDVLPEEVHKWVYLEDMIREHCYNYGYGEIRTPSFEHTALFERGVGETTDIVQKEMYTFVDRGGRSITLKPEGTSPAARAYIEHKLYAEPQPVKIFYITPCFRYERPQSGRFREHHQFGVEVFGAQNASVDAEVISLAMSFLKKLGLKGLELRINSVGCPKCRKEYNVKLKEFLKERLPLLCKTCNTRYETNPLRIIDCKDERCRKAIEGVPLMLDHLCQECSQHFEELKVYLDLLGLRYIVDPRIVRGLDYYTKTAFEIISKDIGAQSTVCGGGRYDGLVKECGGPDTPGIGFGMGIERLILTLESQGIDLGKPRSLDLFIASVGEQAVKIAFEMAYRLRVLGISAECDHLNRSLRAQMKYADKLGVQYTLVLGDEEIRNGTGRLRDMRTGKEIEISLDVEKLKETILEKKGAR